ncbi:hypothetical protein EDD22DRAFT_961923 [Suillus occidentalis]|nr:hypothetical protein EDD22DRAFT_961923 [Suillus occidentalis]
MAKVGKDCCDVDSTLSDNSCNLPVIPNLSTSPLTVDLPSPSLVPPPTPVLPSTPVIPSPPGIAGTSGTTTFEFQDKGKGKAVAVDLAPEVKGSQKRKSPMIFGHSFQSPKSAMKSCKCAKSSQLVKLVPVVESEDEEDTIVQPISCGVLAVILPQLSTIVVRMPQLPHSPGSPKKHNFGPASMTASSRPEVMISSISYPEAMAPPAVIWRSSSPLKILPVLRMGNLLLFPPLISQFLAQTTPTIIVPRKIGPARLVWIGGLTTPAYLHLVCLEEDQMSACIYGNPSQTYQSPSASQSRVQTHSQSRGLSCTLAIPAATTPKVQSCGCSKTITGRKTPSPTHQLITVLSSSVAVPCAALDVSMPDLHSMAIAIRDGAAHITILEAHVQEQNGKIDTLQCLHESLQRQVVDWHPSFPLPDSPANATFLLHQSVPPPPCHPSPPHFPTSSIWTWESWNPLPSSQVQPEGPQSSSKIAIPDDLGNLFPEYNSVSEEMDVEVKAGTSGEGVEMAT